MSEGPSREAAPAGREARTGGGRCGGDAAAGGRCVAGAAAEAGAEPLSVEAAR